MVELALLVTLVSVLWGSAAAAIWWGARARAGERCATCGAQMSNLAPFPLLERQHHVRWCETCGHSEVLVHGAPSPVSYCPACQRRALTVTVEGEEALRPLRVEERCGVCDFTCTHHTELPPRMQRAAKVIAFRPRR